MKKMVEPDAWIKIYDNDTTKYYPVSTNVLNWFEFFRSLSEDIKLTEFYDNKPIILDVETTELNFFTYATFDFLYRILKSEIYYECFTIRLIDDIKYTHNIVINYILLINHIATIDEIQTLMAFINIPSSIYLELMNFPYIKWENYFPDITECKKSVIELISEQDIEDTDYIKEICIFYDIKNAFMEEDPKWQENLMYSIENNTFYKVTYIKMTCCILFLELLKDQQNINILYDESKSTIKIVNPNGNMIPFFCRSGDKPNDIIYTITNFRNSIFSCKKTFMEKYLFVYGNGLNGEN